MRQLLKKMRRPADLVRAYKAGFEGVYYDEREHGKLLDLCKWTSGEDAAAEFGWQDSHKGKLATPFKCIDMLWPNAFPGPAQARGDCVSHSAMRSALGTLACEIVAGKPDEVTGEIEGPPKVSAIGEKNTVLSTEAIYWHRGHHDRPFCHRLGC